MARGGKRIGAGRPAGSGNKPKPKLAAARELEAPGGALVELMPADPLIDCAPDMLPREFFLGLMRNERLPLITRCDAAAAALPYCHGKVGELGKKAQAELDALESAKGSGWAGLLDS